MIYYKLKNGFVETFIEQATNRLFPPAIEWIKLDGEHLETARNIFTGIPMHMGKEVTWYGDDAKFIAQYFWELSQ